MKRESHFVLAFFETEAAADDAARSLVDWARTDRAVEVDAVGVLVKDENGEVKTHKLGPRQTRRGAGVGVVLGVIAAVASGGISLLEGVALGGIGGGGVGSLFHRGLGMSGEDADRIAARLDVGHAAVGVLSDPAQAPLVSERLAELGGEPEVHEVAPGLVADDPAGA